MRALAVSEVWSHVRHGVAVLRQAESITSVSWVKKCAFIDAHCLS